MSENRRRWVDSLRWRTLFVFVSLPVLLLVIVANVPFLRKSPRDSVTPEMYERIQSGMSLVDIEQIVGLPPGDYSPGQPFAVAAQAGGQTGLQWRNWAGKRWIISVAFDQEGRVSHATLVERKATSPTKDHETSWQRLRAWLGV